MELFQSVSLSNTAGFCFIDHYFIMGLCLPNHSCMSEFHHFDGLGSLGLISACGHFGIPHQLSLVGIQGGLSGKQPLQGCIHHPLQSKHLIAQAGWIGPGGLETVDWGRCWPHPEFSIQKVGKGSD